MTSLLHRTACAWFVLAASALASSVQRCDDSSCSSPHEEPGSVLMQRKQSTVKSHHDAPGSFSELASKSAVTGFCIAHPCTVLLSGDIQRTHAHRGIGETATLDESGYKKVAAVKDDEETKNFINRVISSYDCKVEHMGGLMGIVPWFSGTTAVQSFSQLEEVLLFAVLSHGSRWLSYKNTGGATGDTAALTLAGYTQVAAIRKEGAMKRFVERVCKDMGVKIVDDSGLQGVVKYYSGSAAFQSFERLQSEIKSAAAAPHSWANWDKTASLLDRAAPTSETDKGVVAPEAEQTSAMFLLVASRAASKGFCNSHPCSLLSLAQTTETKKVKSPSLDEAGYQMVAAKKDDNQMADFIQRVVAEYDCKVDSMGGLMGIVPWFSGTTTVQSFMKLREVLFFAVLSDGTPWISYKNSAKVTGKSAALDLNGYMQIAAVRKDTEMKVFARRICNDMGVKIVNEDGFDGMIKFYYSGASNFQSFERLQTEIKSAVAAPHSWAASE